LDNDDDDDGPGVTSGEDEAEMDDEEDEEGKESSIYIFTTFSYIPDFPTLSPKRFMLLSFLSWVHFTSLCGALLGND